MESELSIRTAKDARRRWFSQVAFKSVVQPQVLKRRWETKRFDPGAGCTRQTLHLHDYISTCDLESIFTPSSLARLDSTSVAAFGTEVLARRVGKCRGSAAGLGAWVWLGRCSRSLKQVFQEWGEWVSERTSSDMKPSQQTWILLFHDLNKVLVLVTFRTPALMSGRHSGSSLTGTLFDPVVLRPTSTHIGSLTSSLMLPH